MRHLKHDLFCLPDRLLYSKENLKPNSNAGFLKFKAMYHPIKIQRSGYFQYYCFSFSYDKIVPNKRVDI